VARSTRDAGADSAPADKEQQAIDALIAEGWQVFRDANIGETRKGEGNRYTMTNAGRYSLVLVRGKR